MFTNCMLPSLPLLAPCSTAPRPTPRPYLPSPAQLPHPPPPSPIQSQVGYLVTSCFPPPAQPPDPPPPSPTFFRLGCPLLALPRLLLRHCTIDQLRANRCYATLMS